MVEENYLLVLIGKYLGKSQEGSGKDHGGVGGKVMVINSMPADQDTFVSCHQFLNNIVSTIGDPWEAKLMKKP